MLLNRNDTIPFMTSIEKSYEKLLAKIAKNMKRLRKEKGISQPKMAQFGYDVRNYQKLEAGNHSPSLFTLHKLAICFDSAIEEFFK